jgi:hypothetical protein
MPQHDDKIKLQHMLDHANEAVAIVREVLFTFFYLLRHAVQCPSHGPKKRLFPFRCRPIFGGAQLLCDKVWRIRNET